MLRALSSKVSDLRRKLGIQFNLHQVSCVLSTCTTNLFPQESFLVLLQLEVLVADLGSICKEWLWSEKLAILPRSERQETNRTIQIFNWNVPLTFQSKPSVTSLDAFIDFLSYQHKENLTFKSLNSPLKLNCHIYSSLIMMEVGKIFFNIILF